MSEMDRRVAGAEEALRGVSPKAATLPPRDEMLAQAYLRASQIKEHKMTLFNRLFSGRPLAVQLGLAALLLLAFGAVALLLPRPAAVLADYEGTVLSYDLSSAPDPQAAVHQYKDLEKSLAAQLPQGAELKVLGRIEIRKERRIEKHGGAADGAPQETETKVARADVLIRGGDDTTVDKVKAAIAAAIPGAPQPEVKDATWFEKEGAGLDGTGVSISLSMDHNGQTREHVFTFPKDTSADQMKSEIKAWLAQNMPGVNFDVDVVVGNDSGAPGQQQRTIQVKIESKDDQHK